MFGLPKCHAGCFASNLLTRPAGPLRAGFLCECIAWVEQATRLVPDRRTKASLRNVASTVSAKRHQAERPSTPEARTRSGMKRGRFDPSATSRSDRAALQV